MPKDSLRLLALDGGGVRGLSSLMILERLMQDIDSENPPKPCDYFDMIGGTSTGGLIAVMLGRLRMTVSDCIDAYVALSDRVFKSKWTDKFPINQKGVLRPRFDAENLEAAVKETIVKAGFEESSLLKDAPDATCKVFVCVTSKEINRTTCLTSYQNGHRNDLLNEVKIWEACRATSAASTFFKPISIGRYGEEFVDGGTGANNPVGFLWNEAQSVWGSEAFEDRVQCVVSIGTGVPPLKSFGDTALKIIPTLKAIATDTEETAKSFQRDKSSLDRSGRYFRFNVHQGLENIGLEKSKKKREIAAATSYYLSLGDVHHKRRQFAGAVADRSNDGKYNIDFSLQEVPVVKRFVERPDEMASLTTALLPDSESRHQGQQRQTIFVLHGLGGIGKTQLAVEFTRQHHLEYSAVLWLDGSSKDSIKQSISRQWSRIRAAQNAGTTSGVATTTDASAEGLDVDVAIREAYRWLEMTDNKRWLLVIDNVDREHEEQSFDQQAYDIREYIPTTDHGSILITSRLAQLSNLSDKSWQVKRVDKDTAQKIMISQCDQSYDEVELDHLLQKLDGLPLAIVQAAAFLRETGTSLGKYLKWYDERWDELAKRRGGPFQSSRSKSDRTVWTTWVLSYDKIRRKDEHAANLLLLWAYFDDKDMWYGLLQNEHYTQSISQRLSHWVGKVAFDEISFLETMHILLSYSLIEKSEAADSYAVHPVVHQWMYFQGQEMRQHLEPLAITMVGFSTPHRNERNFNVIGRRLLPHAQACCSKHLTRHVTDEQARFVFDKSEQLAGGGAGYNTELLLAIGRLAILYDEWNKLDEAEAMYAWALTGIEKEFGSEHIATLQTINNLGELYRKRNRFEKAELLFKRVLDGCKIALEPQHVLTLQTLSNLGSLQQDRGELAEAETIYKQILTDMEMVFEPDSASMLTTVGNFGLVCLRQDKLEEAEALLTRALQGSEKTLGSEHIDTLRTVSNLGILCQKQYWLLYEKGNVGEAAKAAEAAEAAEALYLRALKGYEKADLSEQASALGTMNNLGNLYRQQDKLVEAKTLLLRALEGTEKALGLEHKSTFDIDHNLGLLYHRQSVLLQEREKMLAAASAEASYLRALKGYEKVLGSEHARTLRAVRSLGMIYFEQERLDEAEPLFLRVLNDYKKAPWPDCNEALKVLDDLGDLYHWQGRYVEAEPIYTRVLEGYEKLLGSEHRSTLRTIWNLWKTYQCQGKNAKAEAMSARLRDVGVVDEEEKNEAASEVNEQNKDEQVSERDRKEEQPLPVREGKGKAREKIHD